MKKSIESVLHNFIARSLFPDQPLRLGETARYIFRNTTITLKRVGNGYGAPDTAATFRYTLTGAGFRISVYAVWNGANVDVTLASSSTGMESFEAWLGAHDRAEAA